MRSENYIIRGIFILAAITIMLGIFALITRRWWVVFGFNRNTKKIIFLSILLIAIFLIGMTLSNIAMKGSEVLGTILIWIIYTLRVVWPLLLIIDIIRIWYKVPVIWAIIACIIWIGFWLYQGIHIKTTTLNISNNKILKNQTMVFISDIHVEAIHNKRYIQSIVDRIQKIKPDFVVIGWDLMNNAKINYVDAFLPFNQVSIPIFATLGNHDHMGDSEAVSKIFERTKIIPLRNKSTELNWIQIVWIDDKSYRSWKTLDKIIKETNLQDNNKFTILISHQPQKLKKLDWFPIDLELAWHTHNGQFIPLSWIIHAFNDYAYGLYTYEWKTAFVSQGIWSRWAPIRMGTQSELVVISLEKKEE